MMVSKFRELSADGQLYRSQVLNNYGLANNIFYGLKVR